jgi:hypothetical protein
MCAVSNLQSGQGIRTSSDTAWPRWGASPGPQEQPAKPGVGPALPTRVAVRSRRGEAPPDWCPWPLAEPATRAVRPCVGNAPARRVLGPFAKVFGPCRGPVPVVPGMPRTKLRRLAPRGPSIAFEVMSPDLV